MLYLDFSVHFIQKNKFNLHTIGTVSTAAFAKFKTERALADPTGVFLTPQASWLIGEGL
jgi:hypothetical protein